MLFKHKTEEASPPAGLGRAKLAEDRLCKGPGAAVWAQESGVMGRNQVKARNGVVLRPVFWGGLCQLVRAYKGLALCWSEMSRGTMLI